MPRFLVKFPQPVTYLPDHPISRRVVTELDVSAPDAARALIHAIRVVSGDVGTPVVAGADETSPSSQPFIPTPYQPAIEVP